jgi:autotransporter-associated beta strand protein
VGTANNSNINDGLVLSGILSGGNTGSTNVVLTKSGAGTMALTGVNTFGGSSAIIDVTAGILSVNANTGLGDASNVVRLSANSATQGLRLAGGTSYTLTGRTINLNAATVGIDVTTGTVATLDTAFTFGAAGNALQKNDNGTLAFTGSLNNTGLTGAWTIAAGALRISDVDQINAATANIVVSNVVGAALELNGATGAGVALNKSSGLISLSNTGINSTGALRALSGTTNSVTSAITQANASTIGVDSTATLNIQGGFAGTAAALTLVGNGTLNIDTTAFINANLTSITVNKPSLGSNGTFTLGVAAPGYTNVITVNNNQFVIGSATTGVGSIGAAANALTVSSGGVLRVDNSFANVDNRLGGAATPHTMVLTDGTFNYIANGTAASAESLGTLTSSPGNNSIILTNSGSAASTLTFAGLASNVVTSGSILTFSSASGKTLGAADARILFTAAPTLTTGIIPRAVVIDAAGTNFATYNATNGIQAFSAYDLSNSLIAAAATATMRLTADTNLAGNAGKTINALYLSGTGVDLTSTVKGGTSLVLTVPNILVSGGTSTIASGVIIDTAATEGTLLVDSGSILEVNGVFRAGAQNYRKGLDGEVRFNTKQYFNTGANFLGIMDGTVTLNGGDNTLYQGLQGGTAGQHADISPGATLNLNGTAQMIGDLVNPGRNAFAGAGGTVTSSTPATFVTNYLSGITGEWGGQITGSIFYNKAGSTNTNFRNDNTYTGATLITGGAVTLIDQGKLSGGGAIAVNFATLILTNTGTVTLNDRLGGSNLTLRGASIVMTGRDNTSLVTETLGTVALAQGSSNITVTNGAAGIRATNLNLGSLTQTNNATLNVQTAGGQMGSVSRLTIANGASLLTNGIIPWAVVGGTELASYVAPTGTTPDFSAGGVAGLNAVGYQGYDGSVLPAASNATGNYRVATTAITLPTGGLSINALNLVPTVAQTVTFGTATDVLNLTAGTLLKQAAFTTTIGSAVDNGRLTAGGTADTNPDTLYIFSSSASTTTINSRIVDNGTDRVKLVFSPVQTAASLLTITNGANSYSGGTTLNGGAITNGQIDLSVTGADGGSVSAIPLANAVADSLVINGGVVRSTIANQINFGITPILNGGSTLNLNALAQTLAGLSFNNNGGTAPTVALGAAGGILKLTGNITATSSNAGSVALISGSAPLGLDLNGADRTFNIAPVTINGSTTVASLTPTLNVTAVIGNSGAAAGIIKTGNGLLQLGGANTFTGGVDLQAGGLVLNANSTASGVGSTVTSGPLGTGALTLGAGTRLLASTAATVANAMTINGSFTTDGILGLTFNGATTLGASPTITVTAPQMVTTIGGLISGSFGITKDGLGTLTLSNAAVANTYTGITTVNNGILSISGNNSLGADPGSVVANQLTIANGAILAATNSPVLAANRGITIGTGGGAFSPATLLQINGKITATTTVSVIGAGILRLVGDNTATLTSGANFNVAAGTLQVVGALPLGPNTTPVNLNGGNLSVQWDGTLVSNGVSPETLNISNAVTMNTTAATITVDRAALTFAPLNLLAANKTIELSNFSIASPNPAVTLTVTNTNGFGLLISNNQALATSGGFPTISVGTASNSNTVQGLTLGGVISGGQTGAVVLTKSGAGTLELTNSGNTFGGTGSTIDVTLGVLSVNSTEALGNVDFIRLSPTAATGSTFRVTDNMTLGASDPRIQFGNATAANLKILQVTEGKTLTLDNAMDFSSFSDNLEIQDLGTTYFGANANNTDYAGRILLRGGVISVDNNTNANAFGVVGVGNTSGDLVVSGTVSSVNASLNLSGGVSISEIITLGTQSGFNQTGAMRSVSGTNTVTSQIWNGAAPFIGADTGSTLNLAGGFAGSGTGLTLTGGGTINFTTTALNAATAPITLGRPSSSNAGTVNIAVASPLYVAAITVSRGTLNVGVAGVGSVGGTGAITVNGNALLNIDDTTTAVANRMGGGRAVTLANAANLTYTANGGAVSSETFGALTSTWGANKITLNNGGGSNATLTFASLASNAVSGGSILNFNSAQTFNGTTNRLVFTTAPTLTNGIIQRAVVTDASGTQFATHGGADTPITAFSAYTNSDGTATGSDLTFTNVNGGTAYGINASNVAGAFSTAPTYRVTADTVALSNPGLNFRQINALKIEGAGTDVTFATSGGTQLALGSGNLLATGTGQTIGSAALVAANSAPAIFLGTISNTNTPALATAPAFASVEGGILVDTGASLTIEAALFNTANVTKGLGGNLTFNTKQFFNTGINYFTINGGMVTLNGGENTLWQGAQGSAALGSSVAVGPGATLNLNGNSQMVGDLRSPNGTAFAGSGGTIINNLATPATFISVNSPAGWGGNISAGAGPIFYNKSGAGTQTFFSDNTYTGGTLINGGNVTLQDEGRLSGTSSIAINNAALALTDAGTMANADRINNAATISMRGGNLSLTGRDLWNSYEQIGALTLDGAQNNLTATVGTNGTVRSAVLEIGNLTQTNYATVLLGGANGQMGNAGRIVIANGSSLLVNGIIPWATDGGTFASYVNPTAGNAAGGLATLNQTGYQGYDASLFTAGSGTTTQNLRLGSASFAVPDVNIGSAGTYNANAVAFNTSANNQTLSFTDNTDTLNLNSGGLIVSGNFTGKTIGSAVGNGFLTSGGTQNSGTAPLYFSVNQGTVLINSSIVNNGNGAATRFVYMPFNGTVVTFNAANTYTGGTQLNGNISHTGTLALNVTGANGSTTVAVPAGDLEINNATVRLDQASQIHTSVVPVLHGAGVLNLNNFNQTLAGLSFINNGSSAAASVTTGTGVLTLTGGITATSSNVGSVSTISGAGTGGTALDLNGANRTFNVAPVTVNGNSTVANVTPSLAISAPIGDSAVSGAGINKTGNGLLQLSGASLFTGGVNVQAGGLAVGASTNVTTRDAATGVVSAFANGPVGTGALTIGASGTYLTSTGANLLSNAVTLAGSQLTLRGTNSLTLQGNNLTTTLLDNTTVTVDAPQAVLTLNMLLDDGGNNFSITKEGLGTLILGNNNTFTGGVTVNAGTLALAGLNSNSTAPVFTGTTATIGDGGLLALQNSGTGSNGLISYANNIVTTGSVSNLHVANNGANTGNAIEITDLLLNGGNILNVSSANGYNLRLLNVSGDAVGGAVPMINVASGLSVTILGFTGDAPINVGQGTLVFPDIVTIGTTTTLAGGAVVLNGTYPLSVTNATLSGANMTSFGHSAGSLTGNFATLSAAPTAVLSTANAGVGFTGSNFAVSNLGDGAFGNRPNTLGGTAVNTVATFSGFLEITAAGNYTFRSGTDDGMTLYINGIAVASDAFGHAFTDSAAITVPLTAGYNSIVYKVANAGGGGGYRLLYSGPDTGSIFQTVGGSKTFATTSLPTAANSFNGAAIINNDYSLAAGTTATMDTAGNQFGAVIDPSKSLALGANSVLNVVNGTLGSFGTGWFGVGGATTIGNGAILATTNTASAGAGTLQLLGAITQSGTGLTTGFGAGQLNDALVKTGQGTLVLGNTNAAFTGDLIIQGGFVQLNDAAALPNSTGTTVLTAPTNVGTTITLGGADTTATLGLQVGSAVSGTGIGAGTYIVSITNPTTFVVNTAPTGALAADTNFKIGTLVRNASAPTTTNPITTIGTNVITLAGADTAGNLGLQIGMAVSGTGIPTGSYITGITSATAFTISQNTTAALAATTFSASGTLDLNGLTVADNVIINGAGAAALAATHNAALWNSSGNAASLTGVLTLAGNASIGGFGDLTLGVINSTGATLTKTGTNTLFLNTANTLTNAPIALTNGIIKIGDANALGAATSLATDGTTISAGAVLDLNGQTTSEFLSINGAGRANFTAARNTLGSLVNSAAGAAAVNSDLVLAAASSIGSDWFNATSGGTAGGNITLGGAVSGAFTLTKVGTNVLTLTAANTYSATTINLGSIVASGAGTLGNAGTITLQNSTYTGIVPNTRLTLDNTGTASSVRLGTRPVTLNGGHLELLGNAETAVNEALATDQNISINLAHNLITLDNNGANLRITTAGTGTFTRFNNATAFIRGDALGQGTGATNTNILLASLAVPTNGTIFVGQTATTGTNIRVMPWAIADISATSTGTSATTMFATYDATNGIRPITAAETATAFTADRNVRMTGALNSGAAATGITSNSINSLTIENAGPFTINAFRNLQVESGGMLAKTSSSITGTGTLTTTAAATNWNFHTYGSGTTLTLGCRARRTRGPHHGRLHQEPVTANCCSTPPPATATPA